MKSKLVYLLFWIILLFFIAFCLLKFYVPIHFVVIYVSSALLPLLIWYIVEFFKKAKFYNEVLNLSSGLEKKYLVHSIIQEPDFLEGQILYEVLYESNKSKIEEVNKYKRLQEEYREYIELWIHEIKTPITAIRLVLQNNPQLIGTGEEVDKIDFYIEQVLYYARSNALEKDFSVDKISIQEAINDVLRKYAKHFIQKGIILKMENTDEFVSSDSKWVTFIVGQIISNAIKYTPHKQGIISIYTTKRLSNIILTIEDNGVGIAAKDIERVWEKGFTGENGRRFGKSTGFGLYLCNNIANQLSIGLQIESKVNEGTKVHLIFPSST